MNLHAQRPHFRNLKRGKIRDLAHFLLIKDINIPCVEIKRLILEYLQYVGPLPFPNDIPGVGFVVQSCNLSVPVQGYLVFIPACGAALVSKGVSAARHPFSPSVKEITFTPIDGTSFTST